MKSTLSFSTFSSASLLISHSPRCLFSYLSHPPSPSLPSLVPLLLADDECWSSGEEEAEWGGEDVSQGAFWCSAFCGPARPQTGWQAGSATVQLEALDRRRRGFRFYLKHKPSHPDRAPLRPSRSKRRSAEMAGKREFP